LQKINRVLSELSQEKSCKIPKINQKTLSSIKEKFEDVSPFSDRYKGKIHEYSIQIEAYTYSSLYTKKNTTIKNIRLDFQKAKNLALKGNILKLEELRDKIKDRRIKQTKTGAIKRAADKKANNRKIKIIVIVGFIFLITIFAITKQLLNAVASPTPLKHKTEYYHTNDIDTIIYEYEKENNTTIYQWRREQIILSLPSQFQKQQVFEMCDENYEF